MWPCKASSAEEKYLWISSLAFLVACMMREFLETHLFIDRAEHGDVPAAPIQVIGGHEIQPYLVGDSAYPLSRWLQKPYPEGTRDPSEIQFNKQLSAARVKVECAFGILKGRWRILSFIEEASVARVSKIIVIIVACAVLHNFCILHRDEWDLDGVDATEMMDKTQMVM